jgi:hypothetical protein
VIGSSMAVEVDVLLIYFALTPWLPHKKNVCVPPKIWENWGKIVETLEVIKTCPQQYLIIRYRFPKYINSSK